MTKDFSYDLNMDDYVERDQIIDIDCGLDNFEVHSKHQSDYLNIFDLTLESMDLDIKLDVLCTKTINNLKNFKYQISSMNATVRNGILNTENERKQKMIISLAQYTRYL